MIRRLRLKFICITMTLVTLLLVLTLGVQYRTARLSLDAISTQALKNVAEDRDPGFRPGIPGQDTGVPCFSISQTLRGELLVSGDPYYDLRDTERMVEIFRAAREMDTVTGVLEDAALRFYRTETLLGVKYVFTDITGEQQTLANLLRSCIFIGVAAFGLFLLISNLLARWAIGPVEKAWQQQRQFVADASHELKTPLTVILTNAELLREEGYTPEEKHRLAENIYSMTRQMRGLVESLLQLARADDGSSREQAQQLNLSRLVQNAVLPFEPVYFEQGLTLESVIEPEIDITGVQRQLVQLVDILLDNGCKYSAPGSTVELTLTRQGHGKCLLRIHSPGTPMSRETCRDIFKRFYRGDEARAMNHSYGLGLSIAREIAQGHRGRIWAEPTETGNVFYVNLPI